MVKNLTMYKIQFENVEFYKSKSGRVQHYRSTEKAEAKIKKLGDIATGATVVESKARTSAVKTEEIVPEIKVEKVSKKKTSAKAKKKDEGATEASVKTKKSKKAPSND